MSEELEFVETDRAPLCQHCGAALTRIEYRRDKKFHFGFVTGASWVILFICPHCHKIIGTQFW
jgi:hypothetical protein